MRRPGFAPTSAHSPARCRANPSTPNAGYGSAYAGTDPHTYAVAYPYTHSDVNANSCTYSSANSDACPQSNPAAHGYAHTAASNAYPHARTTARYDTPIPHRWPGGS